MSIPLVQKAEKDDINTSIIAIKRNIERINMLLGLVDNESPDLSGFATKQELQDAVTELQPVDEVTVGNMQSVSSNAVANSLNQGNFLSGGVKLSSSYGVSVPIQTWTDIVTQQVGSGAYLFVLRLMDYAYWWIENISFVMYFWADGTNNGDASPINFNQSGHAINGGVYASLRYLRRYSGLGSIQLYISGGASPVSVDVRIYKLSDPF